MFIWPAVTSFKVPAKWVKALINGINEKKILKLLLSTKTSLNRNS